MKTTPETDRTLIYYINRARKCLRRGFQMPWQHYGIRNTVMQLARDMEVGYEELIDHIVHVAGDLNEEGNG